MRGAAPLIGVAAPRDTYHEAHGGCAWTDAMHRPPSTCASPMAPDPWRVMSSVMALWAVPLPCPIACTMRAVRPCPREMHPPFSGGVSGVCTPMASSPSRLMSISYAYEVCAINCAPECRSASELHRDRSSMREQPTPLRRLAVMIATTDPTADAACQELEEQSLHSPPYRRFTLSTHS